MKNQNYLAIAALTVAVLAVAGCDKASDSNPPVSTNAVVMPSTNEVINNAPPMVVTNEPAMTNNMTPKN